MELFMFLMYSVIGFVFGFVVFTIIRVRSINAETKANYANTAAIWKRTEAIQQQTREIQGATIQMMHDRLAGKPYQPVEPIKLVEDD